jgi:hypothetical protein
MHDERRKFKRRYIMYYSRIFDRRTGRVIGYIVDLTPEGAMIISEEAVEPGSIFRLRMDLPEDLSNKGYIYFEARSVWCQRDIDPNFWDIGVQLTSIEADDVALIERMVAEYGFRDT